MTKEIISHQMLPVSPRSEQPPNSCRHHFKFAMQQNGCFPRYVFTKRLAVPVLFVIRYTYLILLSVQKLTLSIVIVYQI